MKIRKKSVSAGDSGDVGRADVVFSFELIDSSFYQFQLEASSGIVKFLLYFSVDPNRILGPFRPASFLSPFLEVKRR